MIAETISSTGGGAEIYMANLLRFLAQSGHPVQIYVRRRYTDPIAEGVSVEVVPTMRRLRLLWEKPFARQVAERMRQRPPIIFSALPIPGVTHYRPPSGLYRENFEAIRDSMRPGIPQWSYRLGNGLNLRRHLLVRMQERLLTGPRLPRIIALCSATHSRMLTLNPRLAPNISILPPGVDVQRFHPGKDEANRWVPNRKPGQLILLFAGFNFRLKGLRPLLTAFRNALRLGLDAKLLVVGKIAGNNRSFPPRAALMGLGSQVRFLGTVPREDMALLYRCCDALVHPTYFDTCALVVLEALASGCPVVTTRQSGAAELMESGKHGFVIDHPNEIAQLSEALLALRDRALLARMSAAAAELRPKLDFAAHARQVLAWLTSPPQAAS